MLRDAIADQDILGFIEINLTTDSQSTTGFPTLGVGSLFETISNIPFLGVANQTQNPAPSPLPVGPPLPTGYPGYPTEYHPQRLRLLSKRDLLDRVGAQPRSPPIPLHTDRGMPARRDRELEPYWEHSTYLQLQYSQLVILIFNNVLWPHVTVATMTLSDG